MDPDVPNPFTGPIHAALDLDVPVRVSGSGSLPSAFAVTDLAVASIGAAAAAAARLISPGAPAPVTVDRAGASGWFGWSIRPVDWELPSPWDPVAGDYRTRDGWIRLHTNAPHHRTAALAVLDAPADRDGVAARVAEWRADDLEAAVIASGGCAATMRTPDRWTMHPQGRAVASEPLVAWQEHEGGPTRTAPTFAGPRPLAGLRVLDLTRVLAGPVATRFLAALGADVLRIDPPDWDEPGVIPEVTLGKRCAHLDLRVATDRDRLLTLLADADVLVHGYRPGALDGLGLDIATRHATRPGLVEVGLDAYGWTGPWADRRGFDSLVQMSSGIAEAGMRAAGADRPVPLPVQALDHATGYLLAAAALTGLDRHRRGAAGWSGRLSLARTARLLVDGAGPTDTGAIADPTVAPAMEATAWGPARRLAPPVAIPGVDLTWTRPATSLGSSPPRW